MSFAQYAAGRLFRWVTYGFQTEDDLKESDMPKYRKLQRAAKGAWKKALERLTFIDNLAIDQTALAL